jgi:anti-sigma factor (TIGR02949 family)
MADRKCPDFQKYLQVLHLILDNEATEADHHYLFNHLEGCSCCLNEYELEKQVRELIKTKLEQRPVPPGLTQSIKAKIHQKA